MQLNKYSLQIEITYWQQRRTVFFSYITYDRQHVCMCIEMLLCTGLLLLYFLDESNTAVCALNLLSFLHSLKPL
jgi:hypothetical protein